MGLFRRAPAPEPYEFAALATYNAELSRGIVHTPEWDARMAAEQARFDAKMRGVIPRNPPPPPPSRPSPMKARPSEEWDPRRKSL
jgi:hypothetical protein